MFDQLPVYMLTATVVETLVSNNITNSSFSNALLKAQYQDC